MTDYVPTPEPDDCPKCGGTGRQAVLGGMAGFQNCTKCDGTGVLDD